MIDLLPHQIEDSAIMADQQDSLNWSGMGSGKTLSYLNSFGIAGLDRGLIIAPPIALTMWTETITEFMGMSVQKLTTGAQKIKGEPDFIVTTYGLAAAGQREALADYFSNSATSHGLALDEAHYIKGATSKRTTALMGPNLDGAGGLIDHFDSVHQLTGTPMLRYADDLYPQLRAVRPDVLRDFGVDTYEKWVITFCARKLVQYNKRMRPSMKVVGNKNKEVLKLLIDKCRPIRRQLAEVVEALPPITYRRVDIDTPETKRLAKSIKLTKQEVAEGLANEEPALMAEWQKLYEGRAKEVAEYIKEAARSGPVLVGHWFRSTGASLVSLLDSSDLTIAEVNGSTPGPKRDRIRDLFNEGRIDVLVGQISAMSVSWNIQRGSSHVIMAEDFFSAGMIDQFIGRIFRMGQSEHVQVDWVKSEHPIDEALSHVRETKATDAKGLLDG